MKKLFAAMFVIFCFGTVYAQNINTVHWEVRSYFRDSSYLEQNEFIFVVRTADVEREIFVATAQVERYLDNTSPEKIPIEQLYPEQAVQISSSDFKVVFKKDAIEITFKQDPRFGLAFQSDTGTSGIKKCIELAHADGYRLTPDVELKAEDLFKRTLKLKKNPVQGDDVWVLQQALIKKGYLYTNNVTGIFDAETAEAVKMFQRSETVREGSLPDGIVDSETWHYIFSPPPEIN